MDSLRRPFWRHELKHTLLVVDDEPDVCDSVHDLLRREFRVLKASGAEEGAKLLEENDVHIIMTDQRMPKVTGVEWLSRLPEAHPRAIRLLFTGFADVESIIRAINQGHIFRFIKKPWKPEDLQMAVREAAAEYDRLVRESQALAQLRAEIEELRKRVHTLESEVQQFRDD